MGGPASADCVFISAVPLFLPLQHQQEQVDFVDSLLCNKALALTVGFFITLTQQFAIFSVKGRVLSLFSSQISHILFFFFLMPDIKEFVLKKQNSQRLDDFSKKNEACRIYINHTHSLAVCKNYFGSSASGKMGGLISMF